MNQLILAYSLPQIIYTLTVGSAITLFLAIYITLLVAQVKKATVVETVQLPAWIFWITPMFSGWLDRLTIRDILGVFIKALSIAVVLWMVFMGLLLIVLARGYGP